MAPSTIDLYGCVLVGACVLLCGGLCSTVELVPVFCVWGWSVHTRVCVCVCGWVRARCCVVVYCLHCLADIIASIWPCADAQNVV